MQPTVSRIVHYVLTQQDADSINKRRKDAVLARSASIEDGTQIHVGNSVSEGDVLPMIVVKVWSNGSVNGQVFLDGNDTYWATSIPENPSSIPGAGCWMWPPRV